MRLVRGSRPGHIVNLQRNEHGNDHEFHHNRLDVDQLHDHGFDHDHDDRLDELEQQWCGSGPVAADGQYLPAACKGQAKEAPQAIALNRLLADTGAGRLAGLCSCVGAGVYLTCARNRLVKAAPASTRAEISLLA